MLSELRRRLPVPRSLLGRMLLLTLFAVLLAQTLSSAIWLSQLRATQLEGLVTSARSLAHSMTASVSYLRSLPLAYRPLVLDQLRSMGGTRFVVTLNDKPLDMKLLGPTPRKTAVLDAVHEVLRQSLGNDVDISVSFVSPDDLRIFNGGLKLDELPRSWAHYALTLEPVNPPVLVTQIQMSPGEWLYIASLLPEPYTSLEEEGLPSQQLWFILLTSGFLLLFIGLLVHWQSRPLKRLARSARDMSLGAEEVRPVLEGGGSEVMEVGRALNTMRERISRYLTERSQLFSAISHDLRTPITRLRLRVELLEDEKLQLKFGRDLDELEMLVKGALQCVKDTDIHENIEPVDLNHALDCLIEPYLPPNGNGRVTLDGRALAAFPGKPLALRRCMGNLIDNALKYGDKAHLHIEDDDEVFVLHVDDEGPGVPEQRLEQVFEPHFRLSGQQQGYGLGLGIARNIAHSHGGEVSLQNLREGGLRVTLYLPRNAD
ncbi:HAMP domain-containing sensor histidine kinase [Pseudomonas gingeri]|uniref:HAMP domain-containing sensor histidine kinase n=1 Tax=Pseudomonas gingeri TaxID=117681 RepID=UPI0015A21D3F|nr:HAMP domain-containing sensor histidine kinase [Pseudomonas gingeri]NWA01605.1 HAMP domain-containing histidine kinase [Pseudomonas gingeri]NWA13592.1 HAMP domain-containing histidine kinase [Pseudomonas gingeri]NWA53048.1 HAMP domain-containing histidine kinase [Pseudomonas gingeri]NWA96545.1 HAMP domain-containing histidine kinase [Pseudomonas gingeri]NWA99818.1 HAMP domain-containing histidine kinase [Pseudomonas gingeri]